MTRSDIIVSLLASIDDCIHRYVRLFTSHLHLFKRINNPTVPRAAIFFSVPGPSLRSPAQGRKSQEVNRETGRSYHLSLECVLVTYRGYLHFSTYNSAPLSAEVREESLTTSVCEGGTHTCGGTLSTIILETRISRYHPVNWHAGKSVIRFTRKFIPRFFTSFKVFNFFFFFTWKQGCCIKVILPISF